MGFNSVFKGLMYLFFGVETNPDCFTLVDLQLDVQNSYLFTYNTYIKILYMTHHAQSDSVDTQSNHIRRIYLKFYHYQFSLISNAAN